MRTRFLPGLPLAAILLIGSAAAEAAAAPDCTMHLVVELTPDVPNPQDPSFLSSLVNDHPAYQLTWVRQVDMSFIALDLTGPGPLDRCEDVVDTMRRDGRVMSVFSEPDETNTVSVAASRQPAQESPRLSVSPFGLGALYWATQNPTQAWRIVLPVQPPGVETTPQ